MYIPPYHAQKDAAELQRLIREYPLGLLVSTDRTGAIQVSHVPMLLDEDGGILACHMAHANEHVDSLANGDPVTVVFTGPEHYISPSWYASKAEHGRVVPTWNYAAVYVRGTVSTFTDRDRLIAHLRRMTDAQEKSVGATWRVDDAPADYIEKLAGAIVGVEIQIQKIEGKWKLSQNRPDSDKAGVMEALDKLGTGRADAMASALRML